MSVTILHGLAADEPTWDDPANLSCPPDWHEEMERRSDDKQARAEERARIREEQ